MICYGTIDGFEDFTLFMKLFITFGHGFRTF